MRRLIDLTLVLRQGMRGVEFERKCTVAAHGWNARTLHLYSHCGTHMDAPFHFEASRQTVDQIPLDQCMGPAWVVDIPATGPQMVITVEELGDVATQVEVGDGLLLRTGWSAHVNDAKRYRDQLPRISVGLAEWCVERKIGMVGVEAPSVADVNNLEEVTAVHKILLGGGVIIVEWLDNLGALSQEKVFFAALPLRIEAGDGSPCRAFALEGGSLLAREPGQPS